MDNREPVPVYSGTFAQVAIVKSLLENAEIDAFLKDEIMGTLMPWWTDPGGASPVRVFVPKEDYEKAILVIKDYEQHLHEPDSEEEQEN